MDRDRTIPSTASVSELSALGRFVTCWTTDWAGRLSGQLVVMGGRLMSTRCTSARHPLCLGIQEAGSGAIFRAELAHALPWAVADGRVVLVAGVFAGLDTSDEPGYLKSCSLWTFEEASAMGTGGFADAVARLSVREISTTAWSRPGPERSGGLSALCVPDIEYFGGWEPVPQARWEREHGRPSVQERIWREGDVGWLAEIIQAAWFRWLLVYPGEWRSLGQAIPYVYLRSAYDCNRPKSWAEQKSESWELDALMDATEEWVTWDETGRIGPEPEGEWPSPWTLAHTHAHDHGICLDPWLVDGATEGPSLADTLRHELAHAIAGDFGHGGAWLAMCAVIGYEPSEEEKGTDDQQGRRRATEAARPPVPPGDMAIPYS
jgi:hypothetical protein